MPDELEIDDIGEMRRELAPINDELAAIGLPIVGKLRDSKADLSSAVPILIKWLFQLERRDTKSAVVAALAGPWARPVAAAPLLRAFHEAGLGNRFDGLKWEIGSALNETADESLADELIAIAQDASHGRDRIMVVSALGKLKDSRAPQVLIELLDDPDVYLGALAGLKRLAPPQARPYLEPILNHKNAYARSQAKKAIANIDKKLGKSSASPAQINVIANNAPIPAGYAEAGASFDTEYLEEILTPLAKLAKIGFGKEGIVQVLAGVDAVDELGTVAYDFPIRYGGQVSSVRLIIKSKPGDIDLSVYTVPDLAAKYQSQIEKLLAKLDS